MFFSFLKDLLFPIECLGCQELGAWTCSKCWRRIKLGGPELKLLARQNNYLDQIYIAGDYDDPLLSEIIKKFKYNFIIDLAEPLAAFLAFYWTGQISLNPELSQAILVPIPLSKKRERWRGFNQAEQLAHNLSSHLGLELVIGLERIKHLPPQSSLSESERQKNIRGVFRPVKTLKLSRQIILIDDVVTTGATLEEAASALKTAGAERISALVLAKG